MGKVTVYNKTKLDIDFMLHGEMHHLPATVEAADGEVSVGQIVVSEKRSKEMSKRFGDDVTLNRGDLSGAVNKDIKELRAENTNLANIVNQQTVELGALRKTIQDLKDDAARVKANAKLEEKKAKKE